MFTRRARKSLMPQCQRPSESPRISATGVLICSRADHWKYQKDIPPQQSGNERTFQLNPKLKPHLIPIKASSLIRLFYGPCRKTAFMSQAKIMSNNCVKQFCFELRTPENIHVPDVIYVGYWKTILPVGISVVVLTSWFGDSSATLAGEVPLAAAGGAAEAEISVSGRGHTYAYRNTHLLNVITVMFLPWQRFVQSRNSSTRFVRVLFSPTFPWSR